MLQDPSWHMLLVMLSSMSCASLGTFHMGGLVVPNMTRWEKKQGKGGRLRGINCSSTLVLTIMGKLNVRVYNNTRDQLRLTLDEVRGPNS
jgi:hypothetical protein